VRNKLDQLTGDAQTGGASPTTLGLGYDSAYQLTRRSNSAAGTSSTYTTDNADELTGLATTTNGATTQNRTFTYDRNGDRLTQHDSVSGSNLSYTYDQANRLTAAISGTTTLATYSYDGDGLRQSKTVGSTTTSFVWDRSGSLPLLVEATSPLTTTYYLDGPDGHPIEQITGSTPSYYLYDALGSVRGVLSASGSITASYSYDPYGAITSGNTPTTDYFGFAGEYTDAETGFEYLQARYYDPATGQFISVDPLKDLTGQPYAYAGDNPLTWTDSTVLPRDRSCR
jgi:RHS repeat-associated protein